MRAALSIVVATALVTTPMKLVLAQAAQQEAASIQQTASDSSGHRLIGVPPVTANTARLWEPLASEDALAGIFAYDDSETRVPAPGAPASYLSGVVARVVLVVVGIAAFLLLLFVLTCAGDGGGDIC